MARAKSIKKPRQEKEGRNLPGKRKKMLKQNANSFQQRLALPICQRLSFAIFIAINVPDMKNTFL
jgi:hypothetical protein